MDKTVRMTNAAERAVKIVTDVLDGHMDRARPYFNAEVLAAFTDEVRDGSLATVAGLVGVFDGFGQDDPFVRRIGDYTLVAHPAALRGRRYEGAGRVRRGREGRGALHPPARDAVR
jgi:hypothetical protein